MARNFPQTPTMKILPTANSRLEKITPSAIHPEEEDRTVIAKRSQHIQPFNSRYTAQSEVAGLILQLGCRAVAISFNVS